MFCVLIPLYFTLSFINFFKFGETDSKKAHTIIDYITQGVELFYIFVILIGTTYHIIRVFLWASEHQSGSKVMIKVSRKSRILLLSNIALVGMLCEILTEQVIEDPTLDQRLGTVVLPSSSSSFYHPPPQLH